MFTRWLRRLSCHVTDDTGKWMVSESITCTSDRRVVILNSLLYKGSMKKMKMKMRKKKKKKKAGQGYSR